MCITTGKRLLCLWLPNWPIQRLLATQPDNNVAPKQTAGEQPLVLWGTDPRRGRLVVAACPLATARGVRPGMTLSQADSLVHSSDNSATPWIAPHDGQADLEALQDFAQQCSEQISPWVALETLEDSLWAGQTLHQPQSLFLDVTGIGQWFGSEALLLQAAVSLCEELGFQARMAIADTAGAAWAVAHYALPVDARPELNMPTWIIPAGQQTAAIEPLRIAALRVPSETTTTLRRLGVDSIGALLRLPRSGLASRIGTHLLRRLDEALGKTPEPLPLQPPPIAQQTVIDLEYPTADRDILADRLTTAVHTLTRQIAGTQRGALQLTCRLQTTDNQFVHWRLNLFTPTADATHLTRLMLGMLERQSLACAIQKLFVAITLSGPLSVRQPTLIDLGQEEDSLHELSRFLDSVSNRLGRNQVLGIHFLSHPLPELAFELRPLTGQPIGTLVPGRPAPRPPRTRRSNRPRRSTRKPATTHSDLDGNSTPQQPNPHSPSAPLRRPLVLLKHPQPLPPLQPASPEQQPAQPLSSFRHNGQTHQVMRWWGPERLETGWWQGPLHRRDYYRIEIETGQWWWIYYDLRRNTWWLHGYFP